MQSIVPEFVQEEVTPHKMAQAIIKILTDTDTVARFQEGYAMVKSELGQPGVMSRVASFCLDMMASKDAITHTKEVVE